MAISGRISSSRGTIPTANVTATFRVDGSDLTGNGSGGELFGTTSVGGWHKCAFFDSVQHHRADTS